MLAPLTQSRTILIVDDDVRTAQRLAHMLREDGFDVEVARDGAAAIARFTRAPVPAVLVTELEIPHVDGVAVARFGRAQRPGLPVLVLTVAPNLVNVEAFGSPPALLFTKPVDYADFRDALEVSLRAEAAKRPTVNVSAVAPPCDSELDDSGDALPGAQALRAFHRG